MTQENFNVKAAEKASSAAAGMCSWILAMITYDRVAKIVAPKKAALAVATEKLNVTMAALQVKQTELKEVEDEFTALQDQYVW